MSNWLKKCRDSILKLPEGPFEWKEIDDITEHTKFILESLQDKYEHIALFSYHPLIKQAQWSEYNDSTNLDKYNYNTRLLISESIICLSRTRECEFNDISKVINSLKFVRTSVGNGRSQDGKGSLQMQLSTLTNGIGTFEEAEKIKNEKLTAGAYSFDGERWKYIPDEKLNTFDKTVIETIDYASKIENVVNTFNEVENIKTNFRDTADIAFTYKGRTISFKVAKTFPPIGLTFSYKNILSFEQAISNLDEQMPGLIPSSLLAFSKTENSVNRLDEYIYTKRGALVSKNFGF